MLIITDCNSGDHVMVRNGSPGYENTARISKVATLDGNVAVSHYGSTDMDTPVSVKIRTSLADTETLINMFRNAAIVFLSLQFGLYKAYIARLKEDAGQIRITFYLKERIDV